MKKIISLLLALSFLSVQAETTFPHNVENEVKQALRVQLENEYVQIIDLNVTYLDMDPGSEYYFIADWKAQKDDAFYEDCRAYIVANGTTPASTTLILQKDCDFFPIKL